MITRRFVIVNNDNIVVKDWTATTTEEDWATVTFVPNTHEIAPNTNEGASLMDWTRHPGNLFTPPGPRKLLTPLDFMERLTDAEFTVLSAARETIPQIARWFYRFERASYIDLDDPRVEAGIDALVNAELIAPERKAALLAWP